MSKYVLSSDTEFKVSIGEQVLCEFEDNGNGMEGEIYEGDEPHRLSAYDLISLGEWILSVAKQRIDTLI